MLTVVDEGVPACLDASEAVQRTTAGSRGIEVGEATGGYKLLVCAGVSSWLPRFRWVRPCTKP